MKPIVHMPHPSLRQPAKSVTEVTPELTKLIANLEETLAKTRNPRGVGLSSPQIDERLAVFSTLLPDDEQDGKPVMHSYINPKIIKNSGQKTFGPDPKSPILEGCLSIPLIYGPVPRYSWVELEYQIIDKDHLKTVKARFADFSARVIQHEFDHLQGVLFTDYSLQFGLPVYQEVKNKLELIDKLELEKIIG